MLLVKQKEYERIITKYLEIGAYKKVEQFCAEHAEKDDLLTQLLERYFQMHQEAMEKGGDDETKRLYRELAIGLMRTYGTTGLLDPLFLLQAIPNDWVLHESGLFDILDRVLDYLTAMEEHALIANRLSKLEVLNTELERQEQHKSYLVTRDDTECPACNKTLGFQKIRIFPHGLAFHMRCAKPNECPITNYRFDLDPTDQD